MSLTGFTFIFSFTLWLVYTFTSTPPLYYPSYFNTNTILYGKGLPKYMHFCNDTLPLDDIEVKTSIQKEFYESGLLKNKSSVQLLFSRCERWFPFIEPILKQYKLPDDLKFIAVIESHLSNVTSPMGAKGFWQLLPQTAQSLGLQVDEWVDERLDVEKSTIAACKYFIQAYHELQNWTLVAAAYNYGINGIKYQIEKQHVTSYHQLKINPETKEFVYRIIAYKTLLTYPNHFGITRKLKPKNKLLLKNIKIDTSITDIRYLANYLNFPVLILKAFNPWLLSSHLPNPNKKIYQFKYPANTKADYSPYLSDLLGYSFSGEETSNKSENSKPPSPDSLNLQSPHLSQ